ncbi:hypothetical protein ACFXHA_41250 [Nocardia sp. NPDC059240]|uniref:caspase, EACC1-associated type n=1 Tax=Nocardia sp. NPDC059240 TaxID=3346786 RepID=UPI00369F3A0B
MTLPDPEATRAVLIGAAHYAEDSGFDSFPEIERSLRDFAEFLRSTTGIPDRHIDVVIDPSDGTRVAATITAAARAARGLLLVYYVGHGTVVDNQLHLTHSGSRADDADVTALPYSVIRSRIKRDARGAVVVILDCCHSGKAFGSGVLAPDGELLREAADIDGAFVLTATDEKTKFAVAQGDSGRTAFTGMMLDILRAGVPSEDRYLTMSMLYRELRERLPAAALPKPKALERGTAGRVALAVNAGRAGDARSAGLPDTVATAYTAQIRDLAPEYGLIDRAAELAELAEFCAGEESYVWWQAGPWAGKTALMSWFALHPPAGVRVVSFFITSRLAAQDDHHAFTDAVLEQLSALLPDQADAVTHATGNRDSVRMHLLELAAQRAAEDGGRIVLLVDGLDEDRGRPSIASLLPKRPGPGLRVIVAGRENPGLPLDVVPVHPLHDCSRRELDPAATAFDIRRAARLELLGLLDRSVVDQEVLGLVTAAHGLTGSEIEDLTGQPPFRIEAILSGVTGRTFRTYTSRYAADQINLLAHETLQQEAEAALGRVLLGEYRNRIHAWALHYREQGWPNWTPTYLLTRYFSMLRRLGDIARMTDLALDTARHDRLLDLTGGDGIARTEIATVSELWLAEPDPDLLAVCKLAMRRRRLTQRGTNIPVRLPAAVALLGDLPRARSLADGILRSGRRLRAQIALVAVQFSADDQRHNRALIDGLRESSQRPLTDDDRCRLAIALVDVGDSDGAAELAKEITLPRERVRVLARLVSAWCEAGRHTAVDDAITEINRHALLVKGSAHRDEMVCCAIGAFADVGDFEEAFALGRMLDSRYGQAVALARIARAMASQGEPEPAAMCVGSTLAIAQRQSDLVEWAGLLARVAPDLVAGGFRAELWEALDAVEARLAGYPRPARLQAVERVVDGLLELGDADRALGLGRRFALGTAGLDIHTGVLVALVRAARINEGRRLAAEIERTSYQTTDPYERGFALYTVLRALVIAGDLPRARALAERIDDSGCRFLAYTHLGTRNVETSEYASGFLARAVSTLAALLDRVRSGDDKASWEFTRALFPAARPEYDGAAPAPLAKLARGLVATGAIDSAAGLAGRLTFLYAGWSQPLDLLDHELGRLAAAFTELGRTDCVLGVFEAVAGRGHRLTVMRRMVEEAGIALTAPIVQPLLDDIEQSIVAANYRDTLQDRVDLVLLAATLGDADRIGRLVDGLSPLELDPQHVYSVLATARARSGPLGEAAMIAGAVSDEHERSVAYREVVAALVRAGQQSRALSFSDRIPLAEERIRALALTVPAVAVGHGADTARTTLRVATALLDAIPSADARDRATAGLVEVALVIGEADYALDLARTIAGERRANSLARIAAARERAYDASAANHDSGLDENGNAPHADKHAAARLGIRRLLAEMWSVGPWYSGLDVVARFDPGLLAEIADEALRLDSAEVSAGQMNAI